MALALFTLHVRGFHFRVTSSLSLFTLSIRKDVYFWSLLGEPEVDIKEL